MAKYVIIGGSSGIGQALVKLLVQGGHELWVSYFSAQHLEKVAGAAYFEYDARNAFPKDVPIPEVIDGLVYCPGAIVLKPFNRISTESFLEDYNLQVLGAVRCLQATLPHLLKSVSPSVVFFSTVAVQSGFPFHTQVSASKGAIEGLTRALAAEYASKIRINAIAPSLTDTPLATRILSSVEKKEMHAKMNPMKKNGSPEDLANTAAFLLSDQSTWITGQIIHVDGGMSHLKVS